MDPWRSELIAQIIGKVDDCLAGGASLRKLVDETRGLFDAADISDRYLREGFGSAWAPVDAQLELRTEPWSTPDRVSQEDLTAALAGLREWAINASGSRDGPP